MAMYYAVVMKDSESLSHHGILGQKWGQKNGPPYPLDKSDYSSAERKAMTGSTRNEGTSKSGKTFNKETAKKIAIGVGTAAAVAGGVYLAIRNKDAVSAFIKSKSSVPMSEFKKLKSAAISNGKRTVDDIMSAGKEWAGERRTAEYNKYAPKVLAKHPELNGLGVPTKLIKSEKTQELTKKALDKIIPGTTDAAIGGVAKAKNMYVQAATTGITMLAMKELTDIVLGRNMSGRIMKANDKEAIGKFWRYEEPPKNSNKD